MEVSYKFTLNETLTGSRRNFVLAQSGFEDKKKFRNEIDIESLILKTFEVFSIFKLKVL